MALKDSWHTEWVEGEDPPRVSGSVFLGALLASLLLLLLGRLAGLRHLEVRSTSMSPSLGPGDHLFTEGFSRWFGGRLGRGAVVAFPDPEAAERILLKRVVALPGDAVALRGTRLLLDRVEVVENHARYSEGGLRNLPALVVPEGRVVVLGDDRDQSRDSRDFGPLPIDQILGQVWLRFWPPTRMGMVGPP